MRGGGVGGARAKSQDGVHITTFEEKGGRLKRNGTCVRGIAVASRNSIIFPAACQTHR